MARKRVVVKGLVIGVGFRAAASAEATRLGLKGWVKNRRDARVESLFEGADDAVGSFVEWLRKGPSSARVASIDVTDDATPEELGAFSIKPTG